MGLYDEFRFRPASWLPHSELPLEELERVRNIRREDMEYTNENGYSVRVVLDPTLCMVQDMFYRIVKSDLEDKPFSMICPNQWPAAWVRPRSSSVTAHSCGGAPSPVKNSATRLDL